MQRCWEVIDAQAEEALVSDGFCDIDYDTLKSVLARYTNFHCQILYLILSMCGITHWIRPA